jgi:hypothetical protein
MLTLMILLNRTSLMQCRLTFRSESHFVNGSIIFQEDKTPFVMFAYPMSVLVSPDSPHDRCIRAAIQELPERPQQKATAYRGIASAVCDVTERGPLADQEHTATINSAHTVRRRAFRLLVYSLKT